jgi:hypothetical protein
VARADARVSWPETVAERRFMIALLIIGVIMAGYTAYAIRAAWRKAADLREKRRPTSDTPVYAGAAPGPYAAALGVGALRAVAHREPVDRLAYGRSTRQARALLSEDAENADTARATVPRALRALLGGDAETPAPGIALVEEALRHRTRVGPELWSHALEEFATIRGLPYGERESLLSLATDIGRAEDRLRVAGVLGQNETIPSLLVCHWAEGVHVVRTALAADWLARPQAHQYLVRAGELTARWYPSWSTVLAAQLLPPLLNDDALEIRWRLRAAQRLLHDQASPLRMPLHGGFGLAGAR